MKLGMCRASGARESLHQTITRQNAAAQQANEAEMVGREQGDSASYALCAKFGEDARGSHNGICSLTGLSRVTADVIGSNDVLSAVSAPDFCLIGFTAIASAEQCL